MAEAFEYELHGFTVYSPVELTKIPGPSPIETPVVYLMIDEYKVGTTVLSHPTMELGITDDQKFMWYEFKDVESSSGASRLHVSAMGNERVTIRAPKKGLVCILETSMRDKTIKIDIKKLSK